MPPGGKVARRRRRLPSVAAAAVVALGACVEAGDDETPAPVSVSWTGDTVSISAPLNRLTGAVVLEPDLRIHGLTFPTDVAPLGGGRFVVLDRLDGQLVVFDAEGRETDRWAGLGQGPGEYVEPYAVAGGPSGLMVMDKNQRLTFLDTSGRVRGTVVGVEGDIQTMWQRTPISEWEEPLQLSYEDATRRVAAVGDTAYTLVLQDRDERFDAAFQEGGREERFPHPVLVFDTAGRFLDTLAVLRGPAVKVWQTATARTYPFGRQRGFPNRPLVAAGDGWVALGHGLDTIVSVSRGARPQRTIAWAFDARPVTEADARHFVESTFEAYRRTEGIEIEDQWDRIPWDRLFAQDELLDHPVRPQAMGLIGDRRCLLLQGFRPDEGPHMEATTVLVLDLDDPTGWAVVAIESEPGFVRSLQDGSIFYITVERDGTRAVERYPLPGGLCG